MADDRYLETMEMIAATVAHEVKNPLAMIRVNVDYLALCDKEKKYEKYYQIIRKELNKTNEMLLDFVNLVRPLGQMNEIINIRQITQKAIEDFRASYQNHITFTFNAADENMYITGNSHLFGQVVCNTVKNAIEALPEEGGIIDISLQTKNGALYLAFQDNGTGIDNNMLKKINEGSICTTKQYGNGLGITLCKKIIEAHNGKYQIGNALNKGCLVEITLPLTDSARPK